MAASVLAQGVSIQGEWAGCRLSLYMPLYMVMPEQDGRSRRGLSWEGHCSKASGERPGELSLGISEIWEGPHCLEWEGEQ